MSNNIIKYNKPATIWEEALPLGNGQIGAMLYGGVDWEVIQFNHDTFWTGCLKDETDPKKAEALPAIRQLLKENKYYDAQEYMRGTVMGTSAECYLPIGYMNIHFQEIGGLYTDYTRSLSLKDALFNVDYRRLSSRLEESIPHFRREAFISHPHDVMVMKISSLNGNFIRLTADLSCDVKHDTYIENETLYMKGVAPTHMQPSYSPDDDYFEYGDEKSVNFKMGVKTVQRGGILRFNGNSLVIENAQEVIFYISIKTDFNGFDKEPGGEIDCKSVLDNAIKDGYDKIMAEHILDHRTLYERSQISLTNENHDDEYTDERLKAYKENRHDKGIIELLYNYGKYLMIAGSRKGTQPTNLFGIWSGIYRQCWQGNFTVNINTQMNYWGAEVCNLSECHEPLLKMIEELSIAGEKTAKNHFGCRGFCVNHNTDLWRHTLPIEHDPVSGYWPMAGGWFCRHLWDHYLFTNDIEFVKEKAFPITKKAAEFFVDWLLPDEDGYYITAPSSSPENRFADEEGRRCGVAKATAMDMTIIRETFENTLKMAELISYSDDIIKRIREMLPKLKPLKIGDDGTILEWNEPFRELEPGHRHLSHLYGLYPSDLINEDTNELYKAAEKSLEKRIKNGGGYTGWSSNWIISFFARLHRGNDCAAIITKMIDTLIFDNLFDCHPPFQIDGNYGLIASIAEMLIQSINGKLNLLPALPDEWKEGGSFDGLRARGGYTVSAKWKDGQITYYRIEDMNGKITESNKNVDFGYIVNYN